MSTSALVYLLIGAPLVGFLINGLRFRTSEYKISGAIACAALTVSFLSSIGLFLALSGLENPGEGIQLKLFDWINVAELSVPFAFKIDPINALMLLVITGVGLMIHLFSVGYMSHDSSPAKYFAYLNLFVFNMLILVLADNLLVMFVGWEGVGLCSYLLIGFWFTDSQKAAAGMKAFVTNRIGDAAFLLGMFLLFVTFGTLNFSEINEMAAAHSAVSWSAPLALACLFLFVGASGKSAQIPLYVWLPDAMAGPTPVSALIHAATMVTAGVYLIIRMSGAFIEAPMVLELVAWVGVLTAFFAATIAITQNDIKKVLAYSTVSQLGFMFLAVGVGAFGAALFHLMTHAFFKALMFLGSASVIHAMHDEQDIRKMGGLKKYMPITHLTFLVGWIAIIGLPPFAGFFSKDEILFYTMTSPMGSGALYFVGLVTAALTAFYMTRLVALTFWGTSRVPEDVHPHECTISMKIPLLVLAVLSALGGFLGVPHALGELLPGHPPNWLEGWLHHVVAAIPNLPKADHFTELLLMALSVLVALLSASVAFVMYLRKTELPGIVVSKIGGAFRLVSAKYYVDEFYFGYIVQPLIQASKDLWQYVDVNFIDQTTYLISDTVRGLSRAVRSLQAGNVQHYALLMILGLVLTTLIVIVGS